MRPKLPLLWGRGNLGGILRDNLGEGNCESKVAARQWGVNFCPARQQDVLQGPLGSLTPQDIFSGPDCVLHPFENVLVGPLKRPRERGKAQKDKSAKSRQNSGKAPESQRNAEGASGKGPRQKTSKSVKNSFDIFLHFSRRAKNVKYRQKVSKIFSTFFARHQFSGPFWGALRKDKSRRTT